MIIRSLPQYKDGVFLTFDDGPDPVSTPAVLDVLKNEGVPATFFLISARAKENPELVRRLRDEGHAIGNHSPDHRYSHYFRAVLTDWIEQGEKDLPGSVGFRPPAGILTPPLLRAADLLGVPLILWNERFYDAVIPWTRGRALRSARRLRPGSIVLLHDRQAERRVARFCEALETYIRALRGRGFQFLRLERTATVVGKPSRSMSK